MSLSALIITQFQKTMISKLIPLFYAYSLFFWYCFLPTTAASGNETDLLSLIFIRDSVRGLSSWNNSSHFCQWKGVTCGTTEQRVVALNLSSLNLFGQISTHIGNLSFLQLISVKDNQLNGQIPEEISQLFRLQYVDLSNNAFGGNISSNLSQCTELRTIIFAENALSGVIPPRLGSLPNLRVLALEKNNLTGEIPPSLGNLTSLRFFVLTDNSFHGSIPDAFHNMPNLTNLQFGGNHFSGQLSQSLFNISSLKEFSVASNNITGSLPPDFGLNLPNLEMFCLGENQFFGALPVSLANLTNLVQFDVSSNNFTGPIPINFGVSQNFREINLGFNHLGLGKADDLMFISYLVNSSNLQILALDKNSFGGEFPNSITDLSTQMEMLYLGGNQISGVIPEEIGNLVNLIGLGLQLNLFHGNIPSSLGQMQKLQRLLLQGNRFTGLIPSSIGSISQLSVLSLANNRLEGRIPSALGDCQNLKSLNLSRNNLNGSIPEQVMGISSLSNWLDLSRNSLTGSIPLSVGSLKNLVRIDLSDNNLSGVIPSTFGNCLSLERLFLDNNMIQGPIPLSLSSLRIIQYIDLSSNSLSGGIPKYLESFQYLMRLNLSSNQFVGEVPVEGVFRNASRISVNGNIKLCGGIQELRLQKCETKDSKKDGRSLRIILITIGTALSVLVTLSFLYICWKRNKDRPPPIIHPFQVSGEFSHIQVSYRDLFQATGGFSEMNFIGSGGFGRVYRGYLTLEGGKRMVAIKVFNLDAKGASKSFMDECKSLSNIRHRNLVKIITSCSSTDFEGNDFKALVFEFMSNGSLEMWLHGDGGGQESPLGCLYLLQRLNIAIDIASALKYLHHQCQIPIIHCDMKPSNVLLDNDMVARVGDFGLAKFLSGSMKNLDFQQSTTIAVKGTVGYVPPEYGTRDDVSMKGDVYSFGVLLLELFTGRRPTDEIFIDGLNLHKFATDALNTRIMEIVDPILLSQEEEEHNIENGEERSHQVQVCIASGIRVGVTCSAESPGERMNMEEVVKELNAIRDDFLANLQQKERSSVSNY